MLARTRWRMVEEPCSPEQAEERWKSAQRDGGAGAVTSWGAGIGTRETLRLYWEVTDGKWIPEGEDLAEENWTPYWRESLRTVHVSSTIALVPAWEEVPADVPCAVRIDPGMAFGAGDHPTTRLCVRVLERLARQGELPPRILDVGTGTGVLALTAARLGVRETHALDIDPFGYAACRRNARLNRLEGSIVPLLLSLDLVDERYPLVLANVVASQLGATAGYLRKVVRPNGRLLLSGFGPDAEERVLGALGPGIRLLDRQSEEEWLAVLLDAGSEPTFPVQKEMQ